MNDAKPNISRADFGTMPDGTMVEAVTLRNSHGLSATLLSYGATLQALHAPDRHGGFADVTTGFATLDAYRAGSPYFGSSIGRVANRIAGGRFVLDGTAYAIPPNNGPNALHGGPCGFDKRVWAIGAVTDAPCPTVEMRLTSPDGDQGFPGALEVLARWTLDDGNRLTVDYVATTDKPTIVNLTNHAYWTLAGEGAASGAMGHRLQLAADHFLPTDATAIPTGERRPVDGSAFDFREPRVIGARIRDAGDEQLLIGRGYDHNFIVAPHSAGTVRPVAWLCDPASGRALEVSTDRPGLQFYSGNFLDGSLVGKSGRAYRMGDAVALEPQMFPDTPNQPAFGSLRLDPGETYRHRIVFRFYVEG